MPATLFRLAIAATAGVVAVSLWPVSKKFSNTDLAPRTSEVRYRFDIPANQAGGDDLDDAIALAEARQKAQPDPLEMNELAGLHFARAQLDGDRRDFDAAEQLARKSLTILPAPNAA